MSARLQRINELVIGALPTQLALNPFITTGLLWLLTRGPPRVRHRIADGIPALRNPATLASTIYILKWLTGLGVARTVNRTLNRLALNSWRVKSEKARWNWNEEVAVVTGGCSGMGMLLVKKLVEKGVRVAVLDIQQLPPNLKGNSRVQLFECNVTDAAAVQRTAELVAASMGHPSILVNNAGIAAAHTIFDTTPEYLQKVFAVNVFSNWHTIKAFLPDMVTKNKGHVVTVGSVASFIGAGAMADYCATKAAVLAFHEVLNVELRHKYKAPNVLTSSIHPNWVRTPLLAPFQGTLEAAGSAIIEPQEVVEAMARQIFSCAGGQVILPTHLEAVSALRGFPNWLQEAVRSSLGEMVLKAVE